MNIDLLDLKIPLCVFICWQDNLYTYMYIYMYICKKTNFLTGQNIE